MIIVVVVVVVVVVVFDDNDAGGDNDNDRNRYSSDIKYPLTNTPFTTKFYPLRATPLSHNTTLRHYTNSPFTI